MITAVEHFTLSASQNQSSNRSCLWFWLSADTLVFYGQLRFGVACGQYGPECH